MTTHLAVNIHVDDSTQPAARDLGGGLVTVHIGGTTFDVSTFLRSREHARRYIKAFIAARDLLPEDAPAGPGAAALPPAAVPAGATRVKDACGPSIGTIVGRPDSSHVDVLWDGQEQATREPLEAVAILLPCVPGTCTCGATVDAVGHVTPAVTA